ncbi:MAG: ribonuclease BN [Cyanobacteria bacterium QS_4_48_99]|nr:MAG: ribonuclease BN [Cyanobacteria bacterium QS_4_48_99]
MYFVPFFRFFRYLNLATIRKTISRAFKRRLVGLSAEMAYYTTLALFPAILALITAVGLFEQFFLQSPLDDLASPLKNVAPEQVWQLLRQFIERIRSSDNKSLFSMSFIAAIWISSTALSAAMNALDQIHQIPPEQRRPFWKAKFISIVLTVGTILLLVIASFLVLISDFIVQLAVNQTGVEILLRFWRLLSWPVALGIVAIAFAFIYRFGPSRWVGRTPILPGAVLSAISWAGISGLFRLYVANFGNYNKIYGAVGTVIVLMLWLYMSSLIMLLGDQLNATVGEAMAEKQAVRGRGDTGRQGWKENGSR